MNNSITMWSTKAWKIIPYCVNFT